jgi:chromosome segregation ATPase
MEVIKFKVDNLEKKVDKNSEDIAMLKEENRELTKLSTLMEIQINMNKNQEKIIHQQSETLSKINENLTSLNNVTVNLDKRIGDLEVDYRSERDKNKIDIREVGKKILIGIIIGAVAFALGSIGIPLG